MDTKYLYNWVANQLNAEIARSEIIKNVMSYANFSKEEAEKYVNDPHYRENFKLNNTEETEQGSKDEYVLSEISKIKNELKEVRVKFNAKDWSWIYVVIGLAIGWLIWGFSGC